MSIHIEGFNKISLIQQDKFPKACSFTYCLRFNPHAIRIIKCMETMRLKCVRLEEPAFFPSYKQQYQTVTVYLLKIADSQLSLQLHLNFSRSYNAYYSLPYSTSSLPHTTSLTYSPTQIQTTSWIPIPTPTCLKWLNLLPSSIKCWSVGG